MCYKGCVKKDVLKSVNVKILSPLIFVSLTFVTSLIFVTLFLSYLFAVGTPSLIFVTTHSLLLHCFRVLKK